MLPLSWPQPASKEGHKEWELQFFVTNNSEDQFLYIIRGSRNVTTADHALNEAQYSFIGPGQKRRRVLFGEHYDGEDPGCMRDTDQLWLVESRSTTAAQKDPETKLRKRLLRALPDATIWLHIGPGECFDTRQNDIDYPE